MNEAAPGLDVRCPKCGKGLEACQYCYELKHLDDWIAICDCGLCSHGFHLIACEAVRRSPEPER